MNHHRQRLELTLDLLKGCQHSCAGCMVDKELGGYLEDLPEILALSQSLVDDGYIPFDVALGPTDLMSSTNTVGVFQNPTVNELIKLFHAFTLNAAFLEKDDDKYREMCALVDTHAAGKPVRFLIPAAPAMFRNPRYGIHVSNKLRVVQESFKAASLREAGFVINCTTETLVEGFGEYLRKGWDLTFPVEKDDILNIPYGRAKHIDLMTGTRVLWTSRSIADFYDSLEGTDERSQNPDLDYSTGTMLNLLYTGGKLYWVPFLKDESAFLHPQFEIPRPWTKENVWNSRNIALNSSLDYIADTQCASCPHLSSCSEKGITSMMETLSIKECLVGIEPCSEITVTSPVT